MKSDHRPLLTSVRRDLVLVAAAIASACAFAVHFEVSEAVQDWTRQWERYQLDEFPGILLVAALAAAWFVWRRIGEARAEIARRVALERELAAALDENRRLMRAQVEVQEAERRSLARELHDELGQHLNAIKIDAVSVRDVARDRLPEAHRCALSIIGIADHLHALVRDMTGRLRPAGLDELGLPAALEHYLESWRGRAPGVRLDFAVSGDLEDLGEALNMTLYRLVQEGLTNVSRHANARNVEIRLTRGERPADGIVLTLNDDGRGASDARGGNGVGLAGMRERVEGLGGRIEIGAAPRGFSVSAWLPLAGSAA